MNFQMMLPASMCTKRFSTNLTDFYFYFFLMRIDTHPLQAVQTLLIYKSLGLPLISLNVCPLFRVNPAYKVLIAFQNLDSQRSCAYFCPFLSICSSLKRSKSIRYVKAFLPESTLPKSTKFCLIVPCLSILWGL